MVPKWAEEQNRRKKKKLATRLLNRSREREAAQKAAQAQKPEPVETSSITWELKLPADHPLMEAWAACKMENLKLPEPLLSLELPPAPAGEEPASPLIERDDVAQELQELEKLARGMGIRRMDLIEAAGEGAAPRLDADVRVFMTASRLTAWLLILPPMGGGRGISEELLRSALEAAHVTYGVDEALLSRLPGDPAACFRMHLAARGDPPLHGQDGYVNDMFSRRPPRPFEQNEDGQVDFSSLEVFQSAKKGDVICRIIKPTPCRDGHSVRGEIAYAHGGQPAQIPQGRNTELNEEGDALIASCEGHVEFNGRSFVVKPVMDLTGNVDATSGNVNALGDIHIYGDVCSGFSVRATGSITVDGVIEAAVVEAGGDLVVRKGVQGNGQAVLRAHRSVYARFLESCSVHAREDVEAECIVNCEVFSDGTILVRSGRGKIMGGYIHASNLVSACSIGTRGEMPTAIVMGGSPFEDFERELLEQEMRRLEQDLERASSHPNDPDSQQIMSKIRLQLSADKMKLKQFDKLREKLEADASRPQGRLKADVIHPGVEITIGKLSTRVVLEERMCTVTIAGGDIVFIR